MRNAVSGSANLADRLLALAQEGELTYHGIVDRHHRRYAVTVGGHMRSYHVDDMSRWLAGWTAAADARPADQTSELRRAPLEHVRRVLVNPSVEDQHRIVVRANMDAAGVTVTDLAVRLGVTRKHLNDRVLRFLRPGTLSIHAVLGHNTLADTALADSDPDAPIDLVVTRREPRRMTDMRILAFCHERGIVDWAGPRTPIAGHGQSLDPTTTMAAYGYQIGIRHPGEDTPVIHRVGASRDFRPWITAVADRLASDVGERIYKLASQQHIDDMS